MNFIHPVRSPLARLAAPLLTIAIAASSAHAAVWFVRAPPFAGGAGTSWGTAFNSVTAALAAAAPGDEIRVAAGVYVPGPLRTDSFVVQGETLLGGFPAAGGPLISRDPIANVTMLSGDIGVIGAGADNSYHVVLAYDGVIDGFVIAGGNANGAGGAAFGGGVYVLGSFLLEKCKITRNQAITGGGVYLGAIQPGSALTIDLSTIFDNDAIGAAAAGYGMGGGVAAANGENGRLVIDQCSVLGNTSTSMGGGVFSTVDSLITNTVFSGNDSVGPGGGLWLFWSGGFTTVSNCTLANNHTTYLLGAGGAFIDRVQLVNSILWSNTAGGGPVIDQQVIAVLSTIDYCDTEGGVAPGVGNISAMPNFVNALGADAIAGTLDDDVHLMRFSPCLDVGDNARAAVPKDRDEKNRIAKSKIFAPLVVDMGAYERQIGALHPGPQN